MTRTDPPHTRIRNPFIFHRGNYFWTGRGTAGRTPEVTELPLNAASWRTAQEAWDYLKKMSIKIEGLCTFEVAKRNKFT